MLQTKMDKKGYGQLALSFSLSIFLLSVVYMIKGLYPFGKDSVLMTDMYSQYVPLLYRFYDVVTGKKSLFFDFTISAGANLYCDTINEILNPFNYVLFFFGRENIYLTVDVLLLLYAGAASVSACYFLLKVFPKDCSFNIVLSVCYGLSGFFVYNFQIIKWMILPVIFPLFALALLRLLYEKKGGMYALLLAYQLILSLQHGFMTLLFTLFATGIWFLCRTKAAQKADRATDTDKNPYLSEADGGAFSKKALKERTALLALYTVLGLVISAVAFIPNVMILMDSSRAGENLSYFSVMKRHGLDDLFERIFQIFHPVSAGLFLWLLCTKRHNDGQKNPREYVEGKKKPLREKVVDFCTGKYGWLWLLTGFLWLTVLLQPANLLWHLGSYVCFPVRYGYMVILVQLALIKSMQPAKTTEKGFLKARRMLPAAAAALCICALFITFKWEQRITDAFSSLAISAFCPRETLVVLLVLGLLTAAAFLASFSTWKKGAAVTAVLCLSCAAMNLFFFLPSENQVRKMNMEAYAEMTGLYEGSGAGQDLNSEVSDEISHAKQDLNNQASDEDNGVSQNALLRVKETGDYPLNAGLVTGHNTLAGYLPTGSELYQSTMAALGYSAPWVSVEHVGGSEPSDYLLCESGGLILDASWPEELTAELVSELVPKKTDSANTAPGQDFSLNAVPERTRPLTEAVAFGRKVKVTAEAEAGERIFLPLPNISGWRCKNNGINVEIQTVFSGFMGINATDGSNVIELTFTPPGLVSGGILTAAGLLLLAILLLMERKKGRMVTKAGRKLPDCKDNFVCRSIWPLYWFIETAAVLAIYVIPACGLFIYFLMKISGFQQPGEASVEQPDYHLVQAEASQEGIHVSVAGQNLLLKKGVKLSADSEEGKDYAASKAADGMLYGEHVRWSSENDWEDNDHWLQAEFSESQEIQYIKIFWERDNVLSWTLEYSEDGKNWDVAASIGKESAKTDEGKEDQEVLAQKRDTAQDVRLEEPIAARFFRIHTTEVSKEEEDLSLYYQNVSIRELEMYGPLEDEFVIAAPEVTEGETGRMLTTPEVPEGYELTFLGADYEQLVDYDGTVADSVEEKTVAAGFQLKKDGQAWKLPEMEVVIPAACVSEEGEAGVLRPQTEEEVLSTQAGDGKADVLRPQTAEWCRKAGAFLLTEETKILYSSEELSETAELLSKELEPVLGKKLSVQQKEVNDPENIFLELTGEKITKFNEEETYTMKISQDQGIVLSGESVQAVRWACVTLGDYVNQSTAAEDTEIKNIELKNAEAENVEASALAAQNSSICTLPCGTARDYPKYKVRGFGIDVGRRAVSMNLLREIVAELSAHKMNTLVVHLNDNQIIAQSDYDGTEKGARSLYSGFRLESWLQNEDGEQLTSSDLFYTKEEFAAFMEEAALMGVEIVPEIDTPAHSLAITNLFPNLGLTGDPEGIDQLDVSKKETKELVKEIWTEYLSGDEPVFKAGNAIHLGMDEYYGDGRDYLAYLKEIAEYAASFDADRNLRIWGSLTKIEGDYTEIPRDLQMHIWDTDWADPTEMYEAGFSLINSQSSSLYLIPGGGYDRLDPEILEETWEPNRFTTEERTWEIPSYSQQMLGACYMMWNDWNHLNGQEITEEGLFERFAEPLEVIAEKLW